MTRLGLLARATVLALAGGAVPAAAQMTPIVRLNCTAANYPACGATSHEFNTGTGAHFAYGRTWTAVFLPGAGPTGENVVELRMIPLANPTANDEFYMGWGWSLTSQPTVPQGTAGRRYARAVMRILSPVNAIGPGGGRWGGKLFILGEDGTNDQWRPLWNWRSNLLDNGDTGDPTHLMFRTERNISAGRIDIYSLPMDQWLWVQLEITPSSTATATDASLKMYLNQPNRATPTVQSTGYNWLTTGWSGTSNSRVSFGGYAQAAMTGANVRVQIARFELDDQWDPNWYPGGTTTTPPPAPLTPTLVKVL